MRKQHTLLTTSTILAITLTGCGGLSNRQIENAIEKSFEQKGVCWALKDMENASFPIRTSFDPMAKQANAVLGGLQTQGFIEIGQQEVSNNPFGFFGQKQLVIDLTPAGKKAGVWDPANGFCIGRKQVVEVIRYSEPAEQMGVHMTQVEYRWAIEDVPGWLDRSAFSSIRGLDTPVVDTAVLRKMGDGWQNLETSLALD